MKAHDLARALLAGPNLPVGVISGERNGDCEIDEIEVETSETMFHLPEQDHEAELVDPSTLKGNHLAWYFNENGKTYPWKYDKEPYGIYSEKNDDPCIILIANSVTRDLKGNKV
jgi:hypothetical protein